MRRSRDPVPPPHERLNTVPQCGTSYLWIGSTGKLIPILNPGDPGFEENQKIVAAAFKRPK